MKAWLREVARGRTSARDLPAEHAQAAAAELLDGRATDAQVGAFLVALRLKSETAGELRAFVEELRRQTQRIPLAPELAARAVDCALSHEGRDSFMGGLAASLLCSLAGLPMMLHGARPLPPRAGLGTQDVLDALGLPPTAGVEDAGDDLQRFGIAYADDEALCPPLARLRPVREQLGLRTVLHLAGRLCNPAGAQQVLLGLPHPSALERMKALGAGAGYGRLVAVLGNEGSFDLPTHKSAQVLVFEGGASRVLELNAQELGLQAPLRRGLSLEEQRSRLNLVLSGEDYPQIEAERRLVLWNSACYLWLFGRAVSLGEGYEMALELLRSGRGLTQLFKWVKARPAKTTATSPQ